MSDDLGRKLESAVESVLTTALPSPQKLSFGETEKAGAEYIIIKADRGEEDPPGSGLFDFSVEVKAHGQFTQTEINTIDLVFTGSRELAASMRTAGNNLYDMPQGEACELLASAKTGVGIDSEYTWSFGIWAQEKSISDAA